MLLVPFLLPNQGGICNQLAKLICYEMPSSMSDLPTFEDVKAAAARIAPYAIRTPLIENHDLNERVGGRIFIKPEIFQRTGSFKFRGAYNKLSQIPANKRVQGVVAWSSGNHAQGVALAAKLLGIQATIVMPEDAPHIKIEGTQKLGAKTVFFTRYTEDREKIGYKIAGDSGATIIPSYDDRDIIAGQGTVGLEIMQDLSDQDLCPDHVLIPCGGGGLSSGSGLAIKHASPETSLWVVEPAGYDDFTRSLKSGIREEAVVSRPSLCDALLTPSPGHLTLALNQAHGATGIVVAEAEVRAAMIFAFEFLKLVVEPGGAVALAALLSGAIKVENQTSALVLSGGNVDPALFTSVLTDS